MAFPIKNDFSGFVNLDLDETKIPANAVVFQKNLTQNINANPGSSALAGSNKNALTPLEGNASVSITLPSGDNYTIGSYSSEQTNELYFFVYNSAGSHTIWVISGDDGSMSKVYEDKLGIGAEMLLSFTQDPRYFVAEGRVTLELKSYIDPQTGLSANYKFLIFTTNNDIIYHIEVKSSIATASYTTPATVGRRFYNPAGAFYIPKTLINLGVPTPLRCMSVVPVAHAAMDSNLQNQLLRRAFQFRVKTVDVFGRESTHGIISSVFLLVVGGGCLSESGLLSRCANLIFDAGNAFVEHIQIEFRTWEGNDTSGSVASGWNLYDTINKWTKTPGVQWYNQNINPALVYDNTTNKITYKFCADKDCETIDAEEAALTEPGVPRVSSSVGSLSKRIYTANNVRGFQPVAPAIVDKISFSAEIPDAPCENFLRTVIIYACIYDPFHDSLSIVRTATDGARHIVVWGNSGGDCSDSGSSFGCDMVFGVQDSAASGFPGYMAGTSYIATSVQGDFDVATGNFVPIGYGPTVNTGSFTHAPMQQFRFTLPAGRYVFRIASHKAIPTQNDLQKTSTYFAGTCNLSEIGGSGDIKNYAQNPIKEIQIDCSCGDVIYNQPTDAMAVILDVANNGVGGSVVDGYLYETEGQDIPVEMAVVELGTDAAPPAVITQYGSFFTDHNGFYFCAGDTNIDVKAALWADVCDGAGFRKFLTVSRGAGGVTHGYGGPRPPDGCNGVNGEWFNRVFLFRIPNVFPECGRRRITQRIGLCNDHDTGVPGLPIIMTKSAAGLTNSGGSVSLIAHNRYSYNLYFTGMLSERTPPYGAIPYNTDYLVLSQRGYCPWTVCTGSGCGFPEGCLPFLGDVLVEYIACCSLPCDPDCRTTSETDLYVNMSAINIKGVQSGGRYPIGFVLHDSIGRHTFVQARQGSAGFLDIPQLNDATYQRFALCAIDFAIDPTFAVDPNFKYLTFVVGPNTNFTDYISWSADWVQPVDNTGTTNNINPTYIRIYYGSLNEYNKQNNNTTNTSWEILGSGANNQVTPQEGDVVQFIMNGNGSWLPTGLSATISYVSSGLFFTIEFTDALSVITNGALFRIIRPLVFKDVLSKIYYEQCLTISLTNGVPDVLSGRLPYFDSYILARLLPVPILQGQSGPIPPGGVPANAIQYTNTNIDSALVASGYATNNAANSNGVVIMSVNDSNTSFPFYFESPSPSDFWGSHLANQGRIFAINPYEEERRIGTEIALSDSLSDRGVLNGLSYFESKNAQVFDRNTWGNITAVLTDVGMCLVICDSDHFITLYNQSQIRVDAAGNVSSQNPEGSIFTAPERKQGQTFGLIPFNINTLRKYQGVTYWLDNKGSLVRHEGGDAVDVSKEDLAKGIIGGYHGYLMNKISTVNSRNLDPRSNGTTYFTGGIDPRTKEYYLTSFNIPVSGGFAFYLNGNTDISLTVNETLIVDLIMGACKGFASFTPEYYGMLPGYVSGKNFFTFKQGSAWRHHRGIAASPTTFANFYGTQCEVRITAVANQSPEIVKRYFWSEVYTKENISNGAGTLPSSLIFSDAILTEKGQSSRLLAPQWDIRDGFQTAAFLCDLNTPADPNLPIQTGIHKILDGNPLIGRWIKVSYTNNVLWPGTYFEITSVINYVNGIKKSGGQ